MDAVTRLAVLCCFLFTGTPLTRASEGNTGGRRSHGDDLKDREQATHINLVGEGQPATFTCSAVSSEAMDVSWTHNGTLLRAVRDPSEAEASGIAGNFSVVTQHEHLKPQRPGSASRTLTRSLLRLHRVSLDDAGVYGCRFRDHQGAFSQTSQLVVKPTNVIHDAGMDCLNGHRCVGAHTVCNVSSLRCQCKPGYSTSQGDHPECVPGDLLLMEKDPGELCNSSVPCPDAKPECSKTGHCQCGIGTVWQNGSCSKDKFQLVSWLIWVAASAAVIGAILVAAKVTAHILRKRNYRRGNLLSVNDDSIVSDEDGNDGGDQTQEPRPDHRDHHSDCAA
ncbi:unnamed protein product [Ixodes hexagonus]